MAFLQALCMVPTQGPTCDGMTGVAGGWCVKKALKISGCHSPCPSWKLMASEYVTLLLLGLGDVQDTSAGFLYILYRPICTLGPTVQAFKRVQRFSFNSWHCWSNVNPKDILCIIKSRHGQSFYPLQSNVPVQSEISNRPGLKDSWTGHNNTADPGELLQVLIDFLPEIAWSFNKL